MGQFQITEGFDARSSSEITGSLDVSQNIIAGNSLTVGNDATITDELFLPGIENAATNNVLMYNTTTDAVSFAHKDVMLAADRTVYRFNVTGSSGVNRLTINTTSTPSIYDLNGANIITTNVTNQDNYFRLSLFDYDPAIYGDFSCTIVHKGVVDQDGGANNGDLKFEIYLPNVASIPGGTTYGVSMTGTDSTSNYEVDQFETYNKGELIQFDDPRWTGLLGNQKRRLENSGLFHVFCSFSTNYILVHGTNWEIAP
jgi:hypothetical protein